VARIESLATKIEEARSLRDVSAHEEAMLAQRSTASLFPVSRGQVIRDYVRFQTGYAFKSDWFTEAGIRLARNTNVGHGRLDWSEAARIPEDFRTQFSRFELRAGDIVVSLDRPIISTGIKVAVVTNEDLPCLLLQRVARAQFQNNSVLPDYFFRWLQSPCFVDAIDPGRSNGVPHISHKDIEKIPFSPPSQNEQRRIVAYLDALQAKVDALKKLQSDTATELAALLPSILDKAFKGAL
jgi:type I restriction enzyme, S subunit